MPKTYDPIFPALWSRARDSELGIGIEIEESHRHNITNRLYEARPAGFDDLIMIQPDSDPPEIWIMKKEVDLDAE